jgi:hypothetical protein
MELLPSLCSDRSGGIVIAGTTDDALKLALFDWQMNYHPSPPEEVWFVVTNRAAGKANATYARAFKQPGLLL